MFICRRYKGQKIEQLLHENFFISLIFRKFFHDKVKKNKRRSTVAGKQCQATTPILHITNYQATSPTLVSLRRRTRDKHIMNRMIDRRNLTWLESRDHLTYSKMSTRPCMKGMSGETNDPLQPEKPYPDFEVLTRYRDSRRLLRMCIGQVPTRKMEDNAPQTRKWWKEAVVYQVWRIQQTVIEGLLNRPDIPRVVL